MHVINIHERLVAATTHEAGELLDSLASSNDRLWPPGWPRMRFDKPVSVGAVGGHGPIRYRVESFHPGRAVTFRFLGPSGFDGVHGFEVIAVSERETLLRHTLEMNATGWARLTWPLVFRWLHDALIEDAFSHAEASLGLSTRIVPWSAWVKFLRWVFSGGKSERQQAFK